jgi:amino acid transporter
MASVSEANTSQGELVRAINWKGAFWVASGVPALVLFSIGGIAGTVGIPAFVIWTLSMIMGFVQSFTYAEIAGLFPNKSGGASIYGAAAWLRYSKFIAPLSVWCNWFAWSPVLSLGCAIAAGYVINALAPMPDQAAIAAYIAANAGATTETATAALTPALHSFTLGGFSLFGVGFSFNSTFLIGAILMLITFAIQHRGISGTARVQMIFGLLVIVPMIIVGIVPILAGKVDMANFSPFVPLKVAYAPDLGSWDINGWTLALGGMFIAAWST